MSDTSRPTVADVGRLLSERTRDSDGNRLLTFTDDTTPTGDEVETIIDRTMALLAPRLGSIPASMIATAQEIYALHAATRVEAMYFPQDVEEERGLYAAYREELAEALKSWDTSADENTPGSNVPGIASVRQPTLLNPL